MLIHSNSKCHVEEEMSSHLSFKKVFPTKRLLNRILLQLDSEITSRKLLPIYEYLYTQSTLKGNTSKYVKNPDIIFLMNRVLWEIRNKTKQQSRTLKSMQEYLLRKSAMMGNNDAIALLCYEVLGSSGNGTLTSKSTAEEKKYSENLLEGLIQKNHLLSFKIVGDLNALLGNFKEAKRWYKEYLKIFNLRIPNSKDYGTNINLKAEVLESLGEIEFRDGGIENLINSETRFLEAIKISSVSNCAKSYFYLSQVYIKFNPFKAKILLEQCCTQGFKEAFNELGNLELNYFQNYAKAQEWFKLGMELIDINCYFGYFECCIRLHEWSNSNKCYRTLEKVVQGNQTFMKYFETFQKLKGNEITLMKKNMMNSSRNELKKVGPIDQDINNSKSTTRWGI